MHHAAFNVHLSAITFGVKGRSSVETQPLIKRLVLVIPVILCYEYYDDFELQHGRVYLS